jgi:peptidoglycan/xylan/chitin deacetylase (PgdA/CDA1 family)
MGFRKIKKTYKIAGVVFLAFVFVGTFWLIPSEEKTLPIKVQKVKAESALASAVQSEDPATLLASPEKPPLTALYRIDHSFDVVPIDPAGNRKIILLTIDDGPKSAKTLDPLLKAMKEENVHAIFFSVGELVSAHPELLKETEDAGHVIGNHTWDHANLKKITEEEAKSEIDRTSTIIRKTLGTAPLFFRSPYGAYTEYVKTHIVENKMVFMNWSLGAEDWVKKYQTKDALVAHVLEQLHPGANILMHEYPWTAEAMPEIIKGIKEKGYTIVEPKEIQTL